MPRKMRPKACGCGCGGITKGGEFLPGHDAKLYSAILDKAGGLLELKAITEAALNCRIEVRD